MDPSVIIAGVIAVINAAPKIAALAKSAKNFIAGMFSAGLISKEAQDQAHADVDRICTEAGNPPSSWTVEPDPATE